MEEFISEILAILGGFTVVLAALLGFIGKLWLSRIIEKEKATLQQKMAEIQADLNNTNKKLEAELERSVFIDKLQFEHEFSIYKEIWEALVNLRAATLMLRPTLDFVDPEQTREERIRNRLKAFAGPFETYRKLIEKYKPFYSPNVYLALSEILEKCYGESIGVEYVERKRSEYFKEARENQKQIVEAIDSSCEEIRKRIEEVKVI